MSDKSVVTRHAGAIDRTVHLPARAAGELVRRIPGEALVLSAHAGAEHMQVLVRHERREGFLGHGILKINITDADVHAVIEVARHTCLYGDARFPTERN